VIVRISRSRLPLRRDAALFRSIEPLIEARPRPRGLLDLIVARRLLEDGVVERVIISMWAEPGDLEQAMSPPWDVGTVTDDDPGVSSTSIEQFEIEADDWPEFVEMARAHAHRLS
jgi:hypothetical protein